MIDDSTQLDILHREMSAARKALASAAEADTPLGVLAHLTMAVEGLNATQHELVNYLLDEGASWDDIGAALDTSRHAAERRFPRRAARKAAATSAAKKTASKKTASKKTASKQAAPKKGAPKKT